MITYSTVNTRGTIPGWEETYSEATGPVSQDSHYSWRNTNTLTQQPFRYLADNPDWKIQVSTSQDASAYYKRRQVRWRPGMTHGFQLRYPGGAPKERIVDVGVMDNFYDPFPTLNDQVTDSALRDIALKRLKSKIGNRVKNARLIAPLVEIRELRDTIKAVAYLSIDLVMALINIKRTKGKSAYKFAADAWLQWSFAISPTIKDMQDIAEAIDVILNDEAGCKFTERGAAKKTWFSSRKFGGTFCNGNVDHTLALYNHLSYRFVAGFKTQVASANNYASMSQLGGNIPDLVPAIWELTAFSWLFDYFSTVGDYLTDTFETSNVDCIYVTETRKYTAFGEFLVSPFKPSATRLAGYVSNTKPSSFDWLYIERTPLTSIPARSFRFKTRDEIAANAINKLLNLGSVLVGGESFHNSADRSGARRIWR